MLPRNPMDIPHPFFAPFRDDPGLTAEENIIAYWKIHDAYLARVHEYRALRPSQDDVRVPRDDVVAQLMEFMPPLPGRESDYREWAGITSGRGCMAWDRARHGDTDGLNATTIELFEAYGPARVPRPNDPTRQHVFKIGDFVTAPWMRDWDGTLLVCRIGRSQGDEHAPFPINGSALQRAVASKGADT